MKEKPQIKPKGPYPKSTPPEQTNIKPGVLTAKEENSLPDHQFAAVYTVASTKNGRTSRKTVRKLPIHNANHVRNALARFNQTNLPPHVKAKALARVHAAAKDFGIESGPEIGHQVMDE